MKAYKIFAVFGDEFYSLYNHYDPEGNIMRFNYSKTEWNERLDKMGPYCAFKTLDNAYLFIDFEGYNEDYAICEIECKLSKYQKVWDGRLDTVTVFFTGTVLIDRFKIIREVFEV